VSGFADLLAAEIRRERAGLLRAALLAAAVAAATAMLLGLSGWFITAAGAAGLAGAAAGFNYLLPSATIRLLAIVRTGARYGERLAGHAAAFAVLAQVRPALYRAIAGSPPAAALALTSGEASARLVQDVGAIEMAIARRPARAGAAAAIAAGGLLILSVRPVAALLFLLLAGMAVGLTGWSCRRLDEAGQEVQRRQGALRELLGLQLAAAPELRCYRMEDAAIARIAAADAALADARRRQAAAGGAIEAIGALATGAAAVGVFLLAMPAGTALAALGALTAAAAMDGIMPALRERAARSATREAAARLGALFMPDPPPFPKPRSAALTLPGVGTLVPAGARIAITGATGTGKTSLVEAMIGLRHHDAPGIRLGDMPLAALPAATLRAIFAWAPQDAQLLAGTVRDNLLLADPDAAERALWDALDAACLAGVVRALPHGLDSWIGENGEQLSGGERRRLSLARAYLSRAPWLLLDEPTEALDAPTERAVVERLTQRLARTGQGLIAVTHRDAVAVLCTVHVSPATCRAIDPGTPHRAVRVLAPVD
jgi:ATP-binding cassette subfamily C protein CydC